jgi:hypothetical protein
MLAEQKRRAQKAMGAMGAEQERERTEDARLVKACGEAPRAPTPPLSPVAGPEGVLAGKGAEAAGLTPEQYAIVRERVMVWEAEGGRPRRMGFSQTELDALDARSADLKQAFARLRKAGVPL